jgi:hypothetical protein
VQSWILCHSSFLFLPCLTGQQAIESIMVGKLKATSLQPVAAMSEQAAIQADAYIRTGDTGQPDRQSIDMILLTPPTSKTNCLTWLSLAAHLPSFWRMPVLTLRLPRYRKQKMWVFPASWLTGRDTDTNAHIRSQGYHDVIDAVSGMTMVAWQTANY